jgi:hypothetical protein
MVVKSLVNIDYLRSLIRASISYSQRKVEK